MGGLLLGVGILIWAGFYFLMPLIVFYALFKGFIEFLAKPPKKYRDKEEQERIKKEEAEKEEADNEL